MGREVVKVARGLLVGRWLKQSHYGSVESGKNNKRMLRRKIPPFSLSLSLRCFWLTTADVGEE